MQFTTVLICDQKINQEVLRCTKPKASTFLSVLKKMGSKLSSKPLSGHGEWTSLVDRGGLCHVSNAVFDLFLFLEMTVDDELTSIFQSKGKGIEIMRKDKLNWLCEREEIEFVWSMLCCNEIDDDGLEKELLKEIAFMWISIRGHSKASIIKENYKKTKGTTTNGKHSLRKELRRKDQNKENNACTSSSD